MFTFISLAGPFGFLSSAFGLTGAILAIVQLARPAGRDLIRAASFAAAGAVLIGIVGTGQGMLVCSDAVMAAAPEAQMFLWIRGSAVAWTATALGALWGTIVVVLAGIARLRGA